LQQHPALKVWPSDANFIFLRLQPSPENSPSEALTGLVQKLKAEGTLVRHISNGLRITIGSPEENQRTLHRLQSFLL
jgi:histidinol-phosphate aminotransferase